MTDRAARAAETRALIGRALMAAAELDRRGRPADARAVRDLADDAGALTAELEAMDQERARLVAARRPSRKPALRAPRMEMLDG